MKGMILPVLMGLAAPMVGIAAARSVEKWLQAVEHGQQEVQRAKKELISSADLFELHNKVHAKVGSRDWEARVKPEFMSAITRRTVQETGNLFPSLQDIIQWVRAHPEEAREIMQSLGE